MVAAASLDTPARRRAGAEWATRRAVPVDAPAIWAIHTRAIRHLAAGDYSAAQIAAWSGRMSPAGYALPIAEGRVVVATDREGSIVGFGQLDVDEGVIEAVYTDPDCARRGVGRALVAALETDARHHGIEVLSLEASRNSLPFYRALGYTSCATVRQPLGGGTMFECDVMIKRLDLPRAP